MPLFTGSTQFCILDEGQGLFPLGLQLAGVGSGPPPVQVSTGKGRRASFPFPCHHMGGKKGAICSLILKSSGRLTHAPAVKVSSIGLPRCGVQPSFLRISGGGAKLHSPIFPAYITVTDPPMALGSSPDPDIWLWVAVGLLCQSILHCPCLCKFAFPQSHDSSCLPLPYYHSVVTHHNDA